MGYGNVIKGHVLDISPKYMQRLLSNYDPLLYCKWNPKKNIGLGCWEIRRRPETKTLVDRGIAPTGERIFEAVYKENDMIHHVLDAEHLDMRVMDFIYSADTVRLSGSHEKWLNEMEYRALKFKEAAEKKYDEAIRYQVKENKKYYSELKECIRSGYNLAWFFSNHKK